MVNVAERASPSPEAQADVVTVPVLLRLILTAALLTIVFFNAHWSVGLSLALVLLNLEAQAILAKIRRRKDDR